MREVEFMEFTKFKIFASVMPLLALIIALTIGCSPLTFEGEQGLPGASGLHGSPGADGVDGNDGSNGSTASAQRLEIREDGYWYVNGANTGIKAKSEVAVGTDGYWYIDGEKTDHKAKPDIRVGGDGYIYLDNQNSGIRAATGEIRQPEIGIGDDGYLYVDGRNTGVRARSEVAVGADGYIYVDGENSGIRAATGESRQPEIGIGEDGYWHVDGRNTGVKAKPEISIEDDGYWYVDGENTGIRASPEDPHAQAEIREDGYWYINGKNSGIKAGYAITIGEDGYWYIDGENTGIMAAHDGPGPVVILGRDGYYYIDGERTMLRPRPPVVGIGEDGYWYIDGEKTGIRANVDVEIGGDGYLYINGESTGIRAQDEAPPHYIGADIPEEAPGTLVLLMSGPVTGISPSKFTLTGTTAKISGVEAESDNPSSVVFLLDEPVDASERPIFLSMSSGGMVDGSGLSVPPFSSMVLNYSTHQPIGVIGATVPSSAPNTIQVSMGGPVTIGGAASGLGPAGWSISTDQVPAPAVTSYSIDGDTVTLTLSGNFGRSIAVSLNYAGSTLTAAEGGDRLQAFSVPALNRSPLLIVPPGSGPRNLAHTLLGRESINKNDIANIVGIISATIKNGNINHIEYGDYFGLPSIDIPASAISQGAFSATLADVPVGYGRNLDFVVVAKNPYLRINGNAMEHVVFQSLHVLSDMPAYNTGGHAMKSPIGNDGGYLQSDARAFVINQVKTALGNSGIPVDDTGIIVSLNRILSDGGSQATASVTVTDNVFLPAFSEVFGYTSETQSPYEPKQAYFHYYSYSDHLRTIRRNASGIPVLWWLASTTSLNTTNFRAVTPDGYSGNSSSTARYGIAPCFAIGPGD
jgi:hypothetical protein